MPCYQSIGPEIETARVVLGDQVHPPAEARREGDAARDGTVDPEPVVHRHVICQMHSEAVARKDEMLGERDIRRAEILVALAAGGREPPAVRRREEVVRADRDRGPHSAFPEQPHADRNRTVLVDEGRATFVHERRRGQRDFQKRQERYVQIVIERVVVEGSRRQPVVEEIGSDAGTAVGGHFRRRTVQQAGDTQRRLRRQFRCNGHTSEQNDRYGTPYDPFGPNHHAVETIGFVVGLRSFSISCFRRRPCRRRREPYACRRA